jgi:hypothetical protein
MPMTSLAATWAVDRPAKIRSGLLTDANSNLASSMYRDLQKGQPLEDDRGAPQGGSGN